MQKSSRTRPPAQVRNHPAELATPSNGYMGCRVALQLFPLFCALALPGYTAEHWTKVSTQHFELYTADGKAAGQSVLQVYEEARQFFEQNSPAPNRAPLPVRIIAFKSEKEFKHYCGNPGAAAYYQKSLRRNYIVMQDISPEYYPAAIHEYTHLFLDQLNLTLPLWLNEGLADVYSSLQLRNGQLVVGTPPSGRLETLSTQPWLNLSDLLAADKRSAYYTKRNEMPQFYAESWALAHMLLLGPNYRGRFPEFLKLVSSGKTAGESLEQVYGKSIGQLEADLRGYFARRSISVSVFKTHGRGESSPVAAVPAPLEMELVLADLLSIHPRTDSEARRRLSKLSSELPSSAEVEASLGYLCWQEGRAPEAGEHFERAMQDGSQDAVMLFHYAGLLYRTGAAPGQIMNVLQRAVALNPEYGEARYSLGMEAVNQSRCDLAISNLSKLTSVQRDHAYPMYSAMAYCEAKLGDLTEARRLTQLAQQYARDPIERGKAGDLLQQIHRAEEFKSAAAR